MKTAVLMFAAVFLLAGCGEQEPEGQSAAPTTTHTYDFSYDQYQQLLSRYVVDGRVDYSGLKANRDQLDTLVARLATADLKAATESQQLAFYINAYNMLVLRTIIDHYPVNSIQDIEGALDGKRWAVAGQSLTLDEIDHDILGKKFNDPRYHMAINRGANGAPPLVSQPYYPNNISDQLELVSRYFSSSEKYNRIDPKAGKAELSQVFERIGEELIPGYYDNGLFSNLCQEENAAVTFVIKHHPADQQSALFASDYQLNFREYDWSLNDLR